MSKLLVVFLLLPFFSKSQDDDSLKNELQMIILNTSDNSLVAYAFVNSEDFDSSITYINSNNLLILDSLLTKKMKFEYDLPYYPPFVNLDSSYSKPLISYISSDDISLFLKKSNIVFYIPHAGYLGYPNSKELTEKYGIEIINEGCMPSFSTYGGDLTKIYRLLDIRNGLGWHDKYVEERNKLNQ